MNHRPIDDDDEEEAESAHNGLQERTENHDHLLAGNRPNALGVCQRTKTATAVPHQNGQCRANEDGATTPDGHVSTLAPSVEEDEEEPDESTQCGIGALRPSCLQHLANKKIFLAVFCLASVLQGIYYTYFVSVLTTIEKLFQIPSKTTGIIMSATEMGQIGGALLLTYYGGHGHRPKWIACGMLLFAVASFLCSLPHFLYGSQLSRSLNLRNNASFADPELCYPANATVGGVPTTTTPSALWASSTPFSSPATWTTPASNGMCVDDEPEKQSHITSIVLGIFFISLLFIGIGSTAVYTLGIPYIDDNVANRDSPMYFAITIGVRIIGPVFGFLLGSLCTMIYVNPFEEPMITNKDPRWIGAWWLGPFIVAAALVFVSSAMLAFPRRLPNQRVFVINGHVSSTVTTPSITTEPNSTGSNSVLLTHNNKSPLNSISYKPSIRDFPATMRRLLRNEILLFRTASTVLHILPISGLYTFLPKYLESQFRLTATKANITSGIAGILVMGIGIFASGTFMRIFKPKPRFVAAWIALCALAFSLGMLMLTFVGCPITDFVGLEEGSKQSLLGSQVEEQLLNDSGWEITAPCNRSCSCKNQGFTPVCTSTGDMYHSACYAGCHNYTMVKENSENVYVFHDCECLEENITATLGHCPLECNNFAWYVCIFSITVLIHSTSEVGSMLLTLRCVDPKDKAMALGLISFAIGLFGNVPCPIIYGVVVDSACIVWKSMCGRQGACWFYDPSVFRMFFHGITSAVMFVAFIVDLIVWYKATCIHFSDEDLPKSGEESQPMNSYRAQFETTV